MTDKEKSAMIYNYLMSEGSPIFDNVKEVAKDIIQVVNSIESKQLQVILRDNGTLADIDKYLSNGINDFIKSNLYFDFAKAYDYIIDFVDINFATNTIVNDNKKIVFLNSSLLNNHIATIYIMRYAIANHIYIVTI